MVVTIIREMNMMAHEMKSLRITINQELNNEADELFERLGLTPTAVITAMYTRAVAEGGIPFELKLTKHEKDEMQLTKTVYDSKVPVLNNPEKIGKYLEED
jgi:DNA-damage-inducible protein J